MRLSKRGSSGTYQVRFVLPDGSVVRATTGESNLRDASRKAQAMLEAATQRWVRRDSSGASADAYTWQDACDAYAKVRMHRQLTVDTYEKDGQHMRYLSAAADGEGRPFFGGVPLTRISGATILDYVTCELGRGLTPETINGRLCTLRGILALAAKSAGTDGRPIIAAVPEIERLEPSRAPDGWGRALSLDEWRRFRDNLPVTGETGVCCYSGRRGGGRPAQAVDQRGWTEICLYTASHTADVNTFCPEFINLSAFPVVRRLPTWRNDVHMAPWTYVWRNSKNRARTRGAVGPQVRHMPAELRAVLERLRRVRGFQDGVPVAGYWLPGNLNRDMWRACMRAGIKPIRDGRNREHYVSPNDLRRTAATLLAEKIARDPTSVPAGKMAIEWIAEHLGHTDLTVARTIYDRAAGARLSVVTNLLDDIFADGRVGPKPAPAPLPALIVPLRRSRSQ